MIYGRRSNGKQHGLVLTKSNVVEFMLDRVGYSPEFDLRDVKVIEPAAGSGAFAISIINRLHSSSIRFGFSFQEALSNLRFYEIDNQMAILLAERIEARLKQLSVITDTQTIFQEDFLISSAKKCDLVIGNPPYVRYENIPEKLKLEYRKRFALFSHRSDLFIAFYEKGLSLLKENGTLSFICSNRWLKNGYGRKLRELIHLAFSIDEVIDLERTSPFEEEVIAYPAITTIHKSQKQGRGNYYQIDDISGLDRIDIDIKPVRTLDTGNSLNWFSHKLHDSSRDDCFDSIENQGFKIGIGVATGLDKVFIRKDFERFVEKELLIPIILSKDFKNNELKWSGNYIINPFDRQGRLINLDKFPGARQYFESNKEALIRRHVAKKNPNAWYKTIDKIDPRLTYKAKIFLPDISNNVHLFVDDGKFYPHHNIYHITGQNYNKLELLAAILLSDFIKIQLLELGNKMNGGYPRWQSQNLRKLQTPIIDSIPEEIAQKIVVAYHERDYSKINSLVNEKEIFNNSSRQKQKLF